MPSPLSPYEPADLPRALEQDRVVRQAGQLLVEQALRLVEHALRSEELDLFQRRFVEACDRDALLDGRLVIVEGVRRHAE